MRIVYQPFAQPVQRPAAHRCLAARVIDQAFRDARNPHGAPTDSASARAFLSGSLMLSLLVWLTRRIVLFTSVIRKRSTFYAGTENRV